MKSNGANFRFDDVSVAFGRTAALRGISLSISPGESVGFIGLSGAGKTTLLRLMNGTLHPTSGRVRVDGQDLAGFSPAQMRRLRCTIGFVHQDLRLIPNLRVLPNVTAGRLGRFSLSESLRALLWPSRDLTGEVHRTLERVGIGDKIYQRVDQLSGGEQQRVALARALFQAPKALIADEPVSSVDPARAHDTLSLLRRISREGGSTLCVSLHNIELALEFMSRLVGLRRGRVVFDRQASQVSESDLKALYQLDQGTGMESARSESLDEQIPASAHAVRV